MSLYFMTMGLFVLYKNKKSKVNITFFLFCLSTFWWQFSWFILFNCQNDALASVLVKVGYTGINFIGVTMLHFVVEQFEFKKLKVYLVFCYLLAFVLLIALWTTNLYINGFYKFFWGYYPKAGVIHLAHLFIQMVMGALVSDVLLVMALFKFKNNPLKFSQVKYMLVAMVIYTLAASDYIVNWGYEFYPVGVIFGMITASITAFTIVRYRLMEIDTVIHRTILWIITLSVSVVPTGLLIAFFKDDIAKLNSLAVVGLASVMLLVFVWYFNKLKPGIDHFFRRRKYDYHEMLGKLAQKIGSELELDKVIERLFSELRELIYIRNGIVFVCAPGKDGYEEAGRVGYGKMNTEINEKNFLSDLDKSIVWINQHQKALERGQVEVDPQYGPIRAETLEKMNKYKLEIAIPVVSDGKLNGLIGLGKKDNLQSYTIEDIELLEQMGVQLGVVIENALHHEDILDKQRLQNEMKIAERIQMALIPPIPHNKELEITAITHPAEEVGGDYYDILEDHKQNIWFAIGDVTGHGLTPGLIMMMAQSSFSTILGREGDISPSGALSEVNAVLYKNIVDRLRENHNMTMQFVKYSGNGRFIFSNAGHPDAIIFRNRTRTLEFISNPSSFLGLFPDISDGIIETEFILDQDDILLLYTDGITESKDSHNALWGEERFNETVVQSGQMSLEAMRDIIMEASLAWCHHHAHDDMTLLLVKRK